MRVVIEDVAFAYAARTGRVEVLRSFWLDVASGSIHGLVGPSGCGKTTVLRLIAGLEQPTSGRVELVGEPRFGRRAGFVFESPRLLPWWTVERNVGTGLEFSRRPQAVRERVRDFYTSHVGLTGLRNRRPDQLSLGQQTRAGLGRGLAHEADVLLLDEPFAHLDAISRYNMRVKTERLWLADGRTAVLVTHDVEEAVALADRITVMGSRPGPAVETVEIDARRPRSDGDAPAIRSAIRRVWDALERAGGPVGQ